MRWWSSVLAMRFGLGMAIAGGLVLAACSSGGDADPIESTAPTVETTTATTDAPATTAPPATTEPVESTAPPTSELDPTAALIAEIEADLNEGEQALFAAGADPSSGELRAELNRWYSGRSLERTTEFLDSLVVDGLLMRPSDITPTTVSVRRIDSTVGDPATRGVVLLCRIDTAVVYEVDSRGNELVVNDEVVATLSLSRVNLHEGVWRLDGGSPVEPDPEAEPCEPA